MSKKVAFLVNYDDRSLDTIIQLFSLEHDDETVIKLTRTFCLESSSLEIQKKGMEFLYINGLFEELQFLINKNKKSNHASNEQWAQVYQLMLDQRKNYLSCQKTVNQINSFKTEDPALKCLLEFIMIAVNIRMNDFNHVGNFLDNMECLFDEIDDPFLLKCFQKRLNQILFLYYRARNEVIMARKFAYQVLNQTRNYQTKANIHKSLGLSYTFDTYLQGMYHLNEALRISKKHHIPYHIYSLENHTIPFFSAHFKKVDGVFTNEKSEQAHIEIAKGNHERAVSILNGISLDTPFQLYYMGLAKQDQHLLLKSYESFIKDRSDYFFSRLPLNALRKMGAM